MLCGRQPPAKSARRWAAAVGERARTPPLLPAFVTACTLNAFSNAGFAITASTPASSVATGSKTVSLPAGAVVGAALTVDCSQTSLCGTSSSSVTITLSPVMPTVQVGGTRAIHRDGDGELQHGRHLDSGARVRRRDHLQHRPLHRSRDSGDLRRGGHQRRGHLRLSKHDGDSHLRARRLGEHHSMAVTVAPGGTQQFTATVAGTSNTQVAWSVEEGTAGGGISSSGLYTAPGTGGGTYHVVATSVADTTKSAVATVTVVAASVPWATVTAGSDNSMGLRTDGSLWTWGGNYAGELGNGAALGTFQTSPIKLGSGYAYVAAGQTFDFAITTGGMLYAWGRNTYGQLGIGSKTDASVPTAVGAGFASVTGGYLHSAGIKTDGTLWAWGDNAYGELGDGTTTSQTSPIQVGTDTNWASVSAGYFYTLGPQDGRDALGLGVDHRRPARQLARTAGHPSHASADWRGLRLRLGHLVHELRRQNRWDVMGLG